MDRRFTSVLVEKKDEMSSREERQVDSGWRRKARIRVEKTDGWRKSDMTGSDEKREDSLQRKTTEQLEKGLRGCVEKKRESPGREERRMEKKVESTSKEDLRVH